MWRTDSHWPFFARLRRDDPVHYCGESELGPYWSITKYDDIMAVDTNHQVFSSEYRSAESPSEARGECRPLPMFIAMDPPKHDVQRKAVTPVVSPANLAQLGPSFASVREKSWMCSDRQGPFDWVDKVSIELTTMTLATLFDFPFEDRRKLTRWSDIVTTMPGHGIVETRDQKIVRDCMEFQALLRRFVERAGQSAEPKGDLVSMLAHKPATRNMSPQEYFGKSCCSRWVATIRRAIPSGQRRGAQPVPRRIRQARAQPRTHSKHGFGDNPVANAARAYAPHRA